MKTILVGDCDLERVYRLADPDAPSESEFEHAVARALACIHSEKYWCFVFSGTFQLDDRLHRPDLALVARDLTHWFVIEVELVSHSFEGHVLPQATAFRYGEPLSDCASILRREIGVSQQQALTFLAYVPRTVAVVANKREPRWDIALDAHQIQLLAVSVYRSGGGIEAIEIDGRLEVIKESVGIGQYFATDRSLRFAKGISLPTGTVQIYDPSGAASLWTVTGDERFLWLTKEAGLPDFQDASYVQIVRGMDGQLSFRRLR